MMILSGEKFIVDYLICGDEAQARQNMHDICVEQTVEFPEELITDSDIKDNIIGHIYDFRAVSSHQWLARIGYAIETTAFDMTQLLNVLFGNFSLKPNVRIEQLQMPQAMLTHFYGPRFGINGLRDRLRVFNRPLLCSALKPMGLSAYHLADLAYKMALGGMDFIKDDHGLSNQHFAPFERRVELCATAVARANQETGNHTLYLPNITADGETAIKHAKWAKEMGAGGLLISPGLTGFGTLQRLAQDDAIDLPIMSHPAFLGSFVTSPTNGIAHGVLFGQFMRLAGADASVYPNWGGRFSFTKGECESIVSNCKSKMGAIRAIFPAPGGGITMPRVPELTAVYGCDVIFLMGGGLFRHGPDLVENCRYFRALVEK
jgi:ribulose-bisphosphate carboxylase large chain